ncbi:hypothetical protein [Metallumcola ferriviriculae]
MRKKLLFVSLQRAGVVKAGGFKQQWRFQAAGGTYGPFGAYQ